MSAIYRAQTGKGIMEQFCEDYGIGTYTIDKETGVMRDNQTGDVFKTQKVSYLHLVE